MSEADQHTDNYALLLAEKIGSMAQAVTNLGQRIDLMRDDQRSAHEDLRNELRRAQDAHSERLNKHEVRIDALEDRPTLEPEWVTWVEQGQRESTRERERNFRRIVNLEDKAALAFIVTPLSLITGAGLSAILHHFHALGF